MRNRRPRDGLAEAASGLWSKAFRELFLNFARECLELDLCAGKLKALLALYESGPIPMSKVALLLNTTPATATRVVDGLVDRGLVIRLRDSSDRRFVLCGLSERGEEVADGLWQSSLQRVEMLFTALDRRKPSSFRLVPETVVKYVILAEKEAQPASDRLGDRAFAPHKAAVQCGKPAR